MTEMQTQELVSYIRYIKDVFLHLHREGPHMELEERILNDMKFLEKLVFDQQTEEELGSELDYNEVYFKSYPRYYYNYKVSPEYDENTKEYNSELVRGQEVKY